MIDPPRRHDKGLLSSSQQPAPGVPLRDQSFRISPGQRRCRQLPGNRGNLHSLLMLLSDLLYGLEREETLAPRRYVATSTASMRLTEVIA